MGEPILEENDSMNKVKQSYFFIFMSSCPEMGPKKRKIHLLWSKNLFFQMGRYGYKKKTKWTKNSF
jgi:hypothetical protein